MPASNSPSELKSEADKVLFDALVEIGFYKNIWKFDPIYVRQFLKWLTIIFAALSIWSWSHLGGYKWMFTSFGLVLGLLYWYWFTKVECGGGAFIFSPEWRDTFVRTEATGTNYVVKITVGYELDLKVSIPFSSFEFEDGQVDAAWLADELEQNLPMQRLTQRM